MSVGIAFTNFSLRCSEPDKYFKIFFRGDAKHVRVGITNLTDNNHKQQLTVAQIIPHPLYTSKKYHDIGILKMDGKFNLNTWVRPACLHLERNLPYQNALASGWGKIDFAGDDSKDLLKVKLEIFPIDKCNQTYRRDILKPDSPLRDGIVDEFMICAGSSIDKKDTCQVSTASITQLMYVSIHFIKFCYFEL